MDFRIESTRLGNLILAYGISAIRTANNSPSSKYRPDTEGVCRGRHPVSAIGHLFV